MNIHDHYEPDAPTHEERSHGLFLIDVPLSYHERLEHASAHNDMRASFELWWLDTGKYISDRPTLARKAWLSILGPRTMEYAIRFPLKDVADNKLMAWFVWFAAWSVETMQIEMENEEAQIPSHPENPTRKLLYQSAAETPGFSKWWDNIGSGIPTRSEEDKQEHAHRVALFAYQAGIAQAKGGDQ